ncbi:hypothetical protein AIIKEEIJ_05641 [Rhodococcus sp. YH1]|nr:hypothetical protein [Rhodococcus sp. YH1]
MWLSERTTDLVEEFVGIVRGRTANSSRGRQDESQPKQKRRGERQGSQPKKVVGDKKPKTRRGNAGRPKSAGRARRRR